MKKYLVVYNINGMEIKEERNGLCYAKMLAERHNGKVYKDGVKVWG
jgi:hypothetical protein